MSDSAPYRGEIWRANVGTPPRPHWVVVVSLDSRNQRDAIKTILVVSFSNKLRPGPTVVILDPEETGLPNRSCLRGHFIQPLHKDCLLERTPKQLSDRRMRELCLAMRRSFDPDAPVDNLQG
jgi:mRNA-degrading endonuclease toxin of MazEF toxin-antitoxin module